MVGKRLLLAAFISLFALSAPADNFKKGGGGGTSGPDSVGTSELDDAADTPVTGECLIVAADTGEIEYDSCGAGAGDNVFIDGVAAVNPDFRTDGDITFIRCTGIGAPDAACPAAEDVLLRFKAGVIDAADLATDSVEAAEIAAGAVGTSEISDCTVAAADLGTDSVAADEIAAAAGIVLTSPAPLDDVKAEFASALRFVRSLNRNSSRSNSRPFRRIETSALS